MFHTSYHGQIRSIIFTLAISLLGCDFTGGRLVDAGPIDPDVPGIDPDALIDASPDAVDAFVCTTWSRHVNSCELPPPAPAQLLPLGIHIYDTDIPGFVEAALVDPPFVIIDQAGTSAVVIAVSAFTIPNMATLRVVGARPLIIAASDTIDVQGTIDATSVRGSRAGAGADPVACANTSAALGVDEADNGGGSGRWWWRRVSGYRWARRAGRQWQAERGRCRWHDGRDTNDRPRWLPGCIER